MEVTSAAQGVMSPFPFIVTLAIIKLHVSPPFRERRPYLFICISSLVFWSRRILTYILIQPFLNMTIGKVQAEEMVGLEKEAPERGAILQMGEGEEVQEKVAILQMGEG
jgi:hypothetical protein